MILIFISLNDLTLILSLLAEIAMSQLVSSGDSIKIWDTSTYDCIYDWPSPGNTTGECSVVIVKLDPVPSVSRKSLHIKLVEL